MTNAKHTIECCDAWCKAEGIPTYSELLAVLEQCLPIVDAYRRAALGDGDIAAANARFVIAKARGE